MPSFRIGCQTDDRGPGQGMAELQPPGRRVNEDETSAFCRPERLQAVEIGGRVGQDAQVAGAVEGCQQEQRAGRVGE